MNKTRRTALEKVSHQISELKDELESLMNEEEEYRDNMPDNLIGSEKYERADEVCSMLNDAVSQLDDAISNIDSAAE